MFLAVDLGNTKLTCGIFTSNYLKSVRTFVYPKNITYSELKSEVSNLLADCDIDSCMIASVVDELTENVQRSISEIFSIQPIILTYDVIKERMKINLPQPETCGADRIANAYAALQIYPNRPIIVIDSGSATTFDIVNKKGEFIGGNIMPGLDLQLKSLSEKTSKLPELRLDKAPDKINVISDNTKDAMYAGVVIAHSQAIQGLITLCEKTLGEKAFIIGTGGNINIVSKYFNVRKFDTVNQNLTLEGIKMIYDSQNASI